MRVKLKLQNGAKFKELVFITNYQDHVALHDFFVQKFWVEYLAEMNRNLVDVVEVVKLKRLSNELYAQLMKQAPPGWIIVEYNCVDL